MIVDNSSQLGSVSSEISEEEFVSFKEGNQHAFRRIFNAYYRPIYTYTYNFTKKHEDAEELVQEAFVSLFLHRAKIENLVGLYPYLFVITKRHTISFFRKKVVEAKFETHLKYTWKEDCEVTGQQTDTDELYRIWTAAIETLPHRQQEVYKLNKLEGLSYQEIANKMGVSPNTIKNQLISASKTIKLIVKNLYPLLFFIKTLF